jgi:hypothetical protein
MFKIHEFYWAINRWQGHPTQVDWKNHMALLQKWVAATPQSITARIALANFYIDYAQDARGDGTADTVTDSGWKLHDQREQKAKAILDEAAKLHSKCPEWYVTMLMLTPGPQWSAAKVDDLLQRAIAFAPDYYYYYRTRAYFLMPQWSGEQGAASAFAAKSADRIGGDAGDILYFQIGEKIVCACNEPEFARLSWPRLQKGYTLLEKQYGVSLVNLNRLALMAAKLGDSVVAESSLQRIGDNWDKDAWITEDYFNQIKTWATQIGPAEARSRAILDEAAANLQSAGGAQYQKNIEQAFLPMMRQCSQGAGGDQQTFELAVKVGQDGGPEDVWPRRPTAMAQCLMKQLYEAHIKKEKPFPVPPHPAYWLDLHLDPAAVSASAAN